MLWTTESANATPGHALLLRRLCRTFALIWTFVSISSIASFAWHPMITDDASIVDDKTCQMESWMDRNSDDATYWILSACNFTGNFELTVGGAWTHKARSTQNAQVELQGKTNFKPLETNGWGLGLATGALWHPKDDSSHRAYELYAYVPASFSFQDDRILVHGNLGWSRDSADRLNHLQWGAATEVEVIKPLSVFTEVFGKEQGHPSFQFGFWYWIVPQRMQVNAAYGNRFGTPAGGYWYSVGLSLFSTPFLP
jgi:hypothetical protein